MVLAQLSAAQPAQANSPTAGTEASTKPQPNTTVELTRSEVLSIEDGRFFLEGKPFAEISFNKYDLFWQLYDQLRQGKPLNSTNPLVRAQD